jgi:hypothetical protein
VRAGTGRWGWFVSAILLLICALHAATWLRGTLSWELGGDMDAYWNAALRIRDGTPLFPPLADLNAHDVYRYSPWFAAAWVPLTFLPKLAVTLIWVGALFAATASLLVPLRRLGLAGWLLLLILAPLMAQSAFYGQVQPLMVLALAASIPGRAGPLAIGAAASMKVTPILFALVYVARREWGKAALSLVIAAVLSAPMLLVSLADYPFDSGYSLSPASTQPVLYALLAGTVVLAASLAAWDRSRWTLLAAGAATILASPRIYLDMISYLLPVLGRPAAADDSQQVAGVAVVADLCSSRQRRW